MASNVPRGGERGGPAMWNNVILGIIIAALALTNTYAKASAKV
jgi:hypothetical protein